MVGWLVATAIWMIGIYPMYQGLNNEWKEEFGHEVAYGNWAEKAAVWAAAILWPIAELIGQISDWFIKEDDNGE